MHSTPIILLEQPLVVQQLQFGDPIPTRKRSAQESPERTCSDYLSPESEKCHPRFKGRLLNQSLRRDAK